MAFSYWAREAALALDWNDVYADFKEKNCSIASYHKFYFPKFCHRFGIAYVLGYNAVRRYIRKMMKGEYGANKMQAVQAAENSLTQQPTKTREPENTPSPDEKNITAVSVFDLDLLLKAERNKQKTVQTVSEFSSFPKPSFVPRPPSGEVCSEQRALRAPAAKLRTLNVAYYDLNFSYSTQDPGSELFMLLCRLRSKFFPVNTYGHVIGAKLHYLTAQDGITL